MISDYEFLATGRDESIFEKDMGQHSAALLDAFKGSRVAVIGAAGSIGFSVVKNLLRYQPNALTLIDLSENNLVETVRDLRSSKNLRVPDDFHTMPIALGTDEFRRFFREARPFDYILNLAAVKHVRSEKDIYCLIRMVNTNVVFLHEFLSELKTPAKKFFSVSSDKATNPANLMGASKMAMERVLLWNSDRQPFSTARFANVSFSEGSLPYGFLRRFEKRQPISAPNDIRRFFMSHEEAGQLCVLSCALGDNGDVFLPKLKEDLNEKTFAEIGRAFIERMGFEPVECASEREAVDRADELIRQKKWPCYFTGSDTTGEKAFEEFYGTDERVDLERFLSVGVVQQTKDTVVPGEIEAFMKFALRARAASDVQKADYVRELKKIVPSLVHVETGRNLDQKM